MALVTVWALMIAGAAAVRTAAALRKLRRGEEEGIGWSLILWFYRRACSQYNLRRAKGLASYEWEPGASASQRVRAARQISRSPDRRATEAGFECMDCRSGPIAIEDRHLAIHEDSLEGLFPISMGCLFAVSSDYDVEELLVDALLFHKKHIAAADVADSVGGPRAADAGGVMSTSRRNKPEPTESRSVCDLEFAVPEDIAHDAAGANEVADFADLADRTHVGLLRLRLRNRIRMPLVMRLEVEAIFSGLGPRETRLNPDRLLLVFGNDRSLPLLNGTEFGQGGIAPLAFEPTREEQAPKPRGSTKHPKHIGE